MVLKTVSGSWPAKLNSALIKRLSLAVDQFTGTGHRPPGLVKHDVDRSANGAGVIQAPQRSFGEPKLRVYCAAII